MKFLKQRRIRRKGQLSTGTNYFKAGTEGIVAAYFTPVLTINLRINIKKCLQEKEIFTEKK